MRQLADSTGAITLARTYDPYGVVTSASGPSASGYGFTGEYQSADLVYLRARHYAPGTGRFLTRDTWGGVAKSPSSFNKWIYTNSNPVNFTDPTGNSIYSGICFAQTLTFGLTLNMSAERLIEHCQDFYSQSFWQNTISVGGVGPYNCNILSNTLYNKPTSAGELLGDYICERGPDHVRFNGSDVLTRKLARSIALDKVRRKFYGSGGAYLPRHEEKFGDPVIYINEWNDLKVDPEFPVVHILGSFWITVVPSVGDRINIKVENRTDLASGTHFIGRFPPLGQERSPYSLQSYIREHPSEKNWSAAWLINTHPEIVSILSARGRNQTGPGMGGGNFDQTYTWSESNVHCVMQDMPWPIYLDFLDVGIYNQIASFP